MAEVPIACTLTPDALRTRREGLLMNLVRRAKRRQDLADGLRLEFAPSAETIALITRTTDDQGRSQFASADPDCPRQMVQRSHNLEEYLR